MKNKKIIIIAGPTAVGKTALSISVANKINGEIISADSMQIFKKMDIGTAKIKTSETLGVKHYLIDIVNPDKAFSVANYASLANDCIDDILSRGKVPIIVGGTGLYINSIIYKMDFNNAIPDNSIRDKYNNILNEKGKEHLFSILTSRSQAASESIHPNNVKRVIRALEILDTQDEFTKFSNINNEVSKFKSKIFILSLRRELLYPRINNRVDIMIKNGLVNEVHELISEGLNENNQSMKAIGYRQILSYINKEVTFEEAINIIKRDSRRYAKRQTTWFKKYKDATLLDVENYNTESLTEIILNDYNNTDMVLT